MRLWQRSSLPSSPISLSRPPTTASTSRYPAIDPTICKLRLVTTFSSAAGGQVPMTGPRDTPLYRLPHRANPVTSCKALGSTLCAPQAFRHLWALAARSGALADAVDVDTLQRVRAPLSLSEQRRHGHCHQLAEGRKEQERGQAPPAETETAGGAAEAEILLSSATPCLLPEVHQVGLPHVTQSFSMFRAPAYSWTIWLSYSSARR